MAANNPTNPEDRVIFELLEAREVEFLDSHGRRATESLSQERLSLERSYAELLGLLPAELDPVEPSEGAKARLMAAVGQAGGSPLGERGVDASLEERGAPMVESMTGAAMASERRPVNDNRLRFFLVAAVVALMMVGVSGWFYVQLEHQRENVAQLQDELRVTNLRLEELNDGRRDMVASLRDVGVMEAIPVEWCPLRPAGENPEQPEAHGSLLMVKEHGRWSVRVRNLEAATGDQVYVLWFLNEDRPLKKVGLGRGDRPIQISATGMPELMTAAAVTLEASLDATRPSGPRILYGHSREMDRL